MATARATLAAEHRDIDRQEGRPPPPRRPPARRRLRPRRRLDQHVGRRPRVRAASAPHRPERAGRPVGRRREAEPGPRLRRPGPPGQPPDPPRRPVPRAHDRGADGRRAARGDRRCRRRSSSRAARSSTRASPCASARCRTTCRSRSSTRSSRWSTSTRPSTSATSSIPDDVTLLTDGDEIIAKVQAPRVEEVIEVPAEVGEGVRKATRPPRVRRRRRRDRRDGVRRGLTLRRPRCGRSPTARDRRPDAKTIGKRIVI